MKIILGNNKSLLKGETKWILKLRDHPLMAIRAKGAFFSPAFQRRQWDGFIRFISERGYVETGKVPQVISILNEWKINVEIIDEREIIKPIDIPNQIGPYELRDDQRDAVMVVTLNSIRSKPTSFVAVPFPRGILFAATNFGKTITSAAIHLAYNKKTIFLLNSKELFNDAAREMPRMLPGKVGFISSEHGVKWNDFMIVMVQTAKSRIQMVGQRLASYPVVLVDEGDLATSPSYKEVLGYTFNSFVRIALSGSAMVDKRKKEKNERLRAIFGDIIYEKRNRELMDEGTSAEVKVNILPGNIKVISKGDFVDEYDRGIIRSKERNTMIIRRLKFHLKKGRKPILIMVKNHLHVKILFNRIDKDPDLIKYSMDWVHHKREDRFKITKRFEDGKLNILVGSYILKRGKNFPWMRVLINGSAGDSMANVLQILGRLTRIHESKEYSIIDDFFDEGFYLKRHSKHRLSTYKNEKLKIKNYYK